MMHLAQFLKRPSQLKEESKVLSTQRELDLVALREHSQKICDLNSMLSNSLKAKYVYSKEISLRMIISQLASLAEEAYLFMKYSSILGLSSNSSFGRINALSIASKDLGSIVEKIYSKTEFSDNEVRELLLNSPLNNCFNSRISFEIWVSENILTPCFGNLDYESLDSIII